MKKIFSIVIGAILLVSTVVFSTACFDGCRPSAIIDQTFEIVDSDTIRFGSYPQEDVRDTDLKNRLLERAGDPRTGASGWTSYNYYVSEQKSDCMRYKDVELNGEKYRGVYIDDFRPYWGKDASTTKNTYQDENGYDNYSIYWFKYDWIEWTVVRENGNQKNLVSELILDAQEFDYKEGSSKNNYKDSTIRKWLNETFYETAFNSTQKEMIKITSVDNSLETTGDSINPYVCDDTNDKVYLLSYEEATDYFYSNSQRQKKATEYAKCQGEYVSSNVESHFGYGRWWLRSPGNEFGNFAKHVQIPGIIALGGVYNNNIGVVPALTIVID